MRIHVKNVNINLGQQRNPMPMIAGLLSSIAKDVEAGTNKPSSSSSSTLIPAIGAKWLNFDAVYAGISRGEDGQPDAHLILWNTKPGKDLNYKDATEWAVAVHPDTKSHIPTRFESALLYANLRDQFDHDQWYFTSTHSSADSVYDQSFAYGYQSYSRFSRERRVRAVSRLPL